ncbi:hypothetical protein [Nocardia sp. CDC160]|uniref:hypothetical protein n=1 Tax=Nocardia sp. CDC160 TaxID=3112166 RepID=UPI002DB8E26D|nr:hypothetical protein [Nocardia sp. CDC160]MEC3916468.1 hypothetical protein [Nocardia sp. CDC160]
MNLPRLRRRPAPAITTREHEHRLAWRLGSLTLDYPNARVASRSSGAPLTGNPYSPVVSGQEHAGMAGESAR